MRLPRILVLIICHLAQLLERQVVIECENILLRSTVALSVVALLGFEWTKAHIIMPLLPVPPPHRHSRLAPVQSALV